MNDYQKKFFNYIAEIQEARVQIALSQYKTDDNIESLLYDTSFEIIVSIMEMVDGYSSFCKDKMDIVNQRTGKGLKEEPYIELHDNICGYLKYTRFPDELDNAKVLEYSDVGDFGTIEEREIRYFAIVQYEGDVDYYLFYCDDCEHEYEVIQDDLLESIAICKQIASQWGPVSWHKK